MALQDNFNAVYNKKEQARQEREQKKQQEKTTERELQKELQRSIEGFCSCDSDKISDLYLLRTKDKIINDIIKYNDITIPKNNKYNDIDTIKNYLYSIYDKTLNKVLRLYKAIEQEQKEAEKIQNILIIEQEQEAEEIQEQKHGLSEDAKQNIRFTLLIIVLAPLFLLWGIIEGLCKRK